MRWKTWKINPMNDGSDSVHSSVTLPWDWGLIKLLYRKIHYKYLKLGPHWPFFMFSISQLFCKQKQGTPFSFKGTIFFRTKRNKNCWWSNFEQQQIRLEVICGLLWSLQRDGRCTTDWAEGFKPLSTHLSERTAPLTVIFWLRSLAPSHWSCSTLHKYINN